MSNPHEISFTSYRSASKRGALNFDLNAAPPCESLDQYTIRNSTRSQDRQEAEGNSTLPPPIDVEALDDDDDVIISTPAAFAQARRNSTRNRARPIVVDVDNDERASCYKHRRVPANKTIINCDNYINLESDSNSVKKSGRSAVTPPALIKEATFNCPVCMGTLVEEMTTKCGHIFCKGCIKAAIAAQGKCPTCRRKTSTKDLLRVYLPASRSAGVTYSTFVESNARRS